MDLKEQVNQWCKDNRRPHGYLAEQVGISGGMFSQVLNGKRRARASVLSELEKVMGLETGALATS